MSGRPDVTVVVPTRDRWSLLSRHALPSALGQEGVVVEVVVVDDGSGDRTPERVEASGDARVRVVRQSLSRGPAAARNAGIAAARADWVAFLDDDDLWSPVKLATQLGVVGDAGWCYCGGVVVDDGLHVVDALAVRPSDAIGEELRHGNVVAAGSSSVIARTELLRSLGGFDESLFYVEDWDLWLRLAAAAPAAACDEPLVATLDHAGRALFRDRVAVMRGIEVLLDRIDADDSAQRSAAEWIANEHYRGGRRLQASALYLRAALRFRSLGNLSAALAAPFGDAAMRTAASLLTRAGAESHLDLDRHPPPRVPDWLARRVTALREASGAA